MRTALAVVPPDGAWDRLQRARHVARDDSYSKWPPAIRLFHPFVAPEELSDAALDVAALIEKYDIQPFQVHLNQWNIIPHAEAMEADLAAMQHLPESVDSRTIIRDHAGDRVVEEDREVQQLIEREERVGREKWRIRQQNERQKQREKLGGESSLAAHEKDVEEEEEQEQDFVPSHSPPRRKAASSTLTREALERQKEMYQEYNGPCVVCLEPDEESQEQLQALRYLLKKELFPAYDMYSPTSSVSDAYHRQGSGLPKAVTESSADADDPTVFRPLVPIAAFSTVSSAIAVARKLKRLWEPLSFNVTDLHLMSCSSRKSQDEDVFGYFHAPEGGESHQQTFRGTSWLAHGANEERCLSNSDQFGCDALVALMGEEVDQDEQFNQEMAAVVFERGEVGGYESAAVQHGNLNKEADEDGSDDELGDLEQWLEEEDEEFDEGTVVVIGRTHFFTGEMREYVGMPATSVVDRKDRVRGDNISGAARRRAPVHRKGERYDDGDWGHKEEDFSPWSKLERGKVHDSNTSSTEEIFSE
jgi:hypothetical protein